MNFEREWEGNFRLSDEIHYGLSDEIIG